MSEAKEIEILARGLIQEGAWVLVCWDIKGGYAYLPGGHVEPGEASSEALERELIEETGIRAAAGGCLLVCEQRFTQKGWARHEITIVFHVEPPYPAPPDSDSGCETNAPPTPIESCEEHIRFEWIEQATLQDIDLRPAVIRAWLVSGGDLGDTNRPGWLSITE